MQRYLLEEKVNTYKSSNSRIGLMNKNGYKDIDEILWGEVIKLNVLVIILKR
jgi:hypothetical protein